MRHHLRAARSDAGPTHVELGWHTPACDVKIGEGDFVSGCEYESTVPDWLENYLLLKHEFQKAAPTDYQHKINNYMIYMSGAHLDKGGNGIRQRFEQTGR